jgi:hypothetical protein
MRLTSVFLEIYPREMRVGDMVWVVDCQPSKHKALSSNPGTSKKKEKKTVTQTFITAKNMATTQMSINKWVGNKHWSIMQSWKRMGFSHTHTTTRMSRKYAEQKKPDMKGCLSSDFTYVKCPKKANRQRQKADSWLQDPVMGNRKWQSVLKLEVVKVAQLCKSTKNHWTLQKDKLISWCAN